MQNFIENQVKELNVNKKTNAVLMVLIGLLIAFGGAWLIYFSIGEYNVNGDSIAFYIIAFGVVIILLGLLLIGLAFKRSKNRKLIDTNPYHFIKSYGLKKDLRAAVSEFNEEYNTQKVIYKDKTTFISEKYVLVIDNLSISLGDLSSVAYIFHQVSKTTINKVTYTTWNYFLFFDTHEDKPQLLTIATTSEKSTYIEKALNQLDFDISTDNKLKKQAFKDWRTFVAEQKRRQSAEGFIS